MILEKIEMEKQLMTNNKKKQKKECEQLELNLRSDSDIKPEPSKPNNLISFDSFKESERKKITNLIIKHTKSF